MQEHLLGLSELDLVRFIASTCATSHGSVAGPAEPAAAPGRRVEDVLPRLELALRTREASRALKDLKPDFERYSADVKRAFPDGVVAASPDMAARRALLEEPLRMGRAARGESAKAIYANHVSSQEKALQVDVFVLLRAGYKWLSHSGKAVLATAQDDAASGALDVAAITAARQGAADQAEARSPVEEMEEEMDVLAEAEVAEEAEVEIRAEDEVEGRVGRVGGGGRRGPLVPPSPDRLQLAAGAGGSRGRKRAPEPSEDVEKGVALKRKGGGSTKGAPTPPAAEPPIEPVRPASLPKKRAKPHAPSSARGAGASPLASAQSPLPPQAADVSSYCALCGDAAEAPRPRELLLCDKCDRG